MPRPTGLTFVAGIAIAAILVATLSVAPVAADDPPTSPKSSAVPDVPLSPELAFWSLWARTDDPRVRGNRPYIWGPRSLVPTIDEPLVGGESYYGGEDVRTVLYWDKGRMEVNDPWAPYGEWHVTSGRLVWEMVTGVQQVGLAPPTFAPRAPATIPFGDPSDTVGPTYGSFTGRLADPALAPGEPVARSIDRAGQVGVAADGGVTCAAVMAETGHCIAAPFWAFLHQTGPILLADPGSGKGAEAGAVIVEGPLFDPFYIATGLPISEAYWTTLIVNGRPTRVLLQLFERRVLTYTPDNPADARVEMGNTGRHYYHWRYDARRQGDGPGGLDPAMLAGLATLWETSPAYQYLVDGLADGRYQLIFQDLADYGAYALVSLTYHAILIDTQFARWDRRDLAVVLAHEAQHADGLGRVGVPVNANECYALELRSFLVDAALWQAWYGPGGKPGIDTRPGAGGTVEASARFEMWNTTMLVAIRETPARYVADLREFYAGECSGGGPGSAARFLDLAGMPVGIEAELPVARAFATFGEALVAASADGGSVAAGSARFAPGIAAARAREELASRDDGGPVRTWDQPVRSAR